jgi:F-type H+-transporting ATPase subunit epsilon
MLTFDLITPERVVFSEEIYEAILPTSEGEISVFPNHIPVVTLLKPGVLSLRKQKNTPDSELEHVAISGGFVEITGSRIKVLADTAERAQEINELRAQEAKRKAEEMKSLAKDDLSLTDATRLLERNLVRIKVAQMKKRHGARHQLDVTK